MKVVNNGLTIEIGGALGHFPKEFVVSALEKQIAKKPIKKNPICYAKTKDGQEYFAFDYFCPNCNEKIKLSEHHCKCGQALDWSDTE